MPKFCAKSSNLQENKVIIARVIDLQIKISREDNIKTMAYILLAKFKQIYTMICRKKQSRK